MVRTRVETYLCPTGHGEWFPVTDQDLAFDQAVRELARAPRTKPDVQQYADPVHALCPWLPRKVPAQREAVSLSPVGTLKKGRGVRKGRGKSPQTLKAEQWQRRRKRKKAEA